MDAKKISFGFSKVAKKPNILPSKQPKDENKVELIKCLEGKEIKLVAERVEAAPLIIEMQGSQKTSAALASLMKRRAVLLGEEEERGAGDQEAGVRPNSVLCAVLKILHTTIDSDNKQSIVAQKSTNSIPR